MAGGTTVLIMAAGEGTRMRSRTPKMLHPVCGRALVGWPVAAAMAAGAERIGVIVGPDHDLSGALPEGVETVVQPQADGTGGALRAAGGLVGDSAKVVVLPGDHPLVSAEAIARLLDEHAAKQAAATVVTAEMDDPGSYGRIVRDSRGDVERIVEAKAGAGDATAAELAITEVSSAIFAFDAPALAEALDGLRNDNAQGEYYLGDVLPLIRAAGGRVAAHLEDDPLIGLGVNDRTDLARVEAAARDSIARRHMLAGVTIVDPAATWIEVDVEVEPDARIEPGCLLRGKTRIGAGATVGPHSNLIDASVGAGASVVRSHLVECEVGPRATVGPFTYLRPGAAVGEGAKTGAFVEVKAASIGPGAKVPHLAYVGDAEVGAGANVGAGTITANYDGRDKHRTKIGEDARIGVNNSLVAPVEVGEGAYTGAGAVIREDVPPGALSVSKGEQRNIEGYAARKPSKPDGGHDEHA